MELYLRHAEESQEKKCKKKEKEKQTKTAFWREEKNTIEIESSNRKTMETFDSENW